MYDGLGMVPVPMQIHHSFTHPMAPTDTQFLSGVQQVSGIQAGLSSMGVSQSVQCLVPGRQKCAIPECPNPSYIDENGTVHKCCGRTHARELEQRQCKEIISAYI